MPALPEYFEFQDRTKLIYGENTLDVIGGEAAALGGTRALIVTGSTAQRLGHLDTIRASLSAAGVEPAAILDKIPVDSDVNVVERGNEIARAANCDITIAIGGGSIMDTAKGVNILLSEGGNLLDDHQGAYLLEHPIKPLIAVPTTSGSGSEVTFAAVIKSVEQSAKLAFISPYLAPNVAILDPIVTVKMPPGLTAATGMDALTHSIETMLSTMASPISDALAFGSIRMIEKYLRKAVANGDDVEARGRMLIASTIAGLAFSNGLVGMVHGLAHTVGAISHVPHGTANSILLPWCMEWNLEFCREACREIALAMGVSGATAAIDAVRMLSSDIGMPQKLSEVGVKEEDLEQIAEMSLGDGSMVTNPRPVDDPADMLEVLKKAF